MSDVLLKDRVAFEYGFAVRVNEEPDGMYPIFGSNGPTGSIDSYKIEGPGVIVGRKGSVGKINFSPKNYTPTDTTYYLRIIDSSKDDIKFWFYYLPLLNLERLNTHSAVPGLNRDVAYFTKVNPPEKKIQKKIVAVLSALDAKIELNNRINTELETMAKTIYDYWFVQFDFPDKNGKPYKSSGGKMVYNETLKRPIPKGWSNGTLWDIANYFNGLPMQKNRPTGSDFLPVIKIKEMNGGYSAKTEKASLNIDKNAIINSGDVLFSWSATLDVQIWSKSKGALNQHIFKVTSKDYPRTYYYFELLNYLEHFKMMAEKRKTTMGHITQDHLKQSRICIPPKPLTDKAHAKINPVIEQYLTLKEQNQKLTELRNWLLPMLMNGQIIAK